jgi:hypothetical protein
MGFNYAGEQKTILVGTGKHGGRGGWVRTTQPAASLTNLSGGPSAMVESLPNGVSWTNLIAGICSLRDQRASPKPPDGEHQESQR